MFLFLSAMAAQAHYGLRIKTDPDGNVIVVGDAYDRGTLDDIFTIKYSATGVALWTNRFNGPGKSEDNAAAVAVDNHGNVFVLGTSIAGTNRAYVTLAYSGAGVPLWTNSYNAPGGWETPPRAGLALGDNGNLFITGNSSGGAPVSYTAIVFALSAAGQLLWTNTHPGAGRAVAVSGNGNVFALAGSENSCITLAYTGAGAPIWTNRCNALNLPMAMAVNTSGKIFVTGAAGGSAYDFATLAYSGAGVPLWTNWFSGPAYMEDYPMDLAVDDRGNVFVTGYTENPVWPPLEKNPRDYATLAYSGTGTLLWSRFHAGPYGSWDSPRGIAVDNSGNVVVTGTSAGDYVTIKYSGAGVALWTNRYDGPTTNSADGAFAVAVDSSGNVFVTGISGSDCATVAYSAAGAPLWTNRYRTGPGVIIQPLTNGSSTINLKLYGTPNTTWYVERALIINGPWTNLGQSVIGTNGLGFFLDAEPPPKGAFYRATAP